jgi:ankyrin repeat protein
MDRVADGLEDVCSYLLQNGAFVDALRNDGQSPLFEASHKGYRDVVRVLLKYKPKLGLLPVSIKIFKLVVLIKKSI